MTDDIPQDIPQFTDPEELRARLASYAERGHGCTLDQDDTRYLAGLLRLMHDREDALLGVEPHGTVWVPPTAPSGAAGGAVDAAASRMVSRIMAAGATDRPRFDLLHASMLAVLIVLGGIALGIVVATAVL